MNDVLLLQLFLLQEIDIRTSGDGNMGNFEIAIHEAQWDRTSD